MELSTLARAHRYGRKIRSISGGWWVVGAQCEQECGNVVNKWVMALAQHKDIFSDVRVQCPVMSFFASEGRHGEVPTSPAPSPHKAECLHHMLHVG